MGDMDDLLHSSEITLQAILKECELKKGAILKIIIALKSLSKSQIYKDSNEVKVSVISEEESEASFNIKQENVRINEAVQNITDMIDSLNANSKTCQHIINLYFDAIIKSTNERRKQLLTSLN